MSGSGVLGVGKRVVSGSDTRLADGVWVSGGNVGLGAILALGVALLGVVLGRGNFAFGLVWGL